MAWRLIGFGIALVLPMLIVLFFIAYQSSEREKSRIEGEVEGTALSIADDFDRLVSIRRDMLSILATAPSLQTKDYRLFGSQARSLAERVGQPIMLRSLDGTRIADTQSASMAGSLRIKFDIDAKVIQTQAPAMTELVMHSASGIPSATIVVPVIRDQRVTELLSLDIGNGDMLKMLRRGLPPEYLAGSISDRNSIVAARTRDNAKWVGRPITGQLKEAIRGNSGTWDGPSHEGRPLIGGYARAKQTGWLVAVGVERAVVEAPFRNSIENLAFLAIILGTASIVLATLIARSLTRPIAALTDAAAQLGRTGKVVPFSTGLRETDEVATALTQAGEALRDREARLRLALDAGNLGVLRDDLVNDFVELDSRARALYDLDDSRVSRAAFIERIHPEDRAALRKAFIAATRPGGDGNYTASYRIKRRDGSIRWTQVHGRFHFSTDGGKALYGIGTTQDVTQEKLAESKLQDSQARLEALNINLERQVEERTGEAKTALTQLYEIQKMESLGQLTGGVAHDFNNLLMAALSSLGLLRKRMSNDKSGLQLLDNAIQANERGAVLTQRLLSFARRQDLKPASVRIPELVDGMKDLLRRSLGPAYMISTRFEENLSPALVDPNQLELAILNLAVNARDAMPDGGSIEISAREEELRKTTADLSQGNYVVVCVRDHGTGMDEATLARAREPFFTTKGVGKGTGLGLSMVHGLCAQLDGALQISSSPGMGTTIELWLRQAEDMEAAMPHITHIAPTSPRPDSRGLEILVVDDDPLVAMGTIAMLEDIGHHGIKASSGKEAWNMLQNDNAFDIVITDFAMPGMSGAELAQRIKTRYPNLPVILASGYAELPEGIETPVGRLAKPFGPGELMDVIASVMENKTL
ncbi:MAG: ATP-binding protein [Sphingorhabdus sp.]